ncbi:hypothetical protein FHW96_000249 [Novosphingobium sp. SG751A]|nr:hypothetical protein [Novosphingobium sp. SG751A]
MASKLLTECAWLVLYVGLNVAGGYAIRWVKGRVNGQ